MRIRAKGKTCSFRGWLLPSLLGSFLPGLLAGAITVFPGFAGAEPFEGREAVVSGPSPYCPGIVRDVFQLGGNLADMAAACAMSLAVTHPYYVSLGAGGFALIKMEGETQALDFRETAPRAMGPDFYAASGLSSRKGGASVGVPGFAAGIKALHKRHGRLPWTKILQPAFELAKKGFPVSGDWVRITNKARKRFGPAGQKLFFRGGRALRPNEIFKQPRLAKAIALLQKKGPAALKSGPLGSDIIRAVRQSQGVMDKEDLKSYQVRWLKPVSVSFRGHQIHSMPLPSSGGIVLSRALKLIERQSLHKQPLLSGGELHLLAEIMSRAFRPRSLMGDFAGSGAENPDSKKGPQPARFSGWISEAAIEEASRSISPKKAIRLPPLKMSAVPPGGEPGETTHISLMDKKGRAIAMTITLNGFYGSYLVTGEYGITLNNQMDDFSALPGKPNMYGLVQGRGNEVQGGRRPLSSMTPMIAERGGRAVLALGGAGGPTIITGVLQTLYRHLAHGMDIAQAIQSPRIHHQFLPRQLFAESKRFSPEVMLYLKSLGHQIKYRDYIAQVFAASLREDQAAARLFASHETRREGSSGGL